MPVVERTYTRNGRTWKERGWVHERKPRKRTKKDDEIAWRMKTQEW